MGALLMAAALTACGSQGTGGGGSTGGAQQDTPADESGTGQQDISGTEQTDAQQNEGDADAEPSTTSDNTLKHRGCGAADRRIHGRHSGGNPEKYTL